ncbi:MAG: hypothetical protein AAGC99_22705 [Pseudomonadota bacterium]
MRRRIRLSSFLPALLITLFSAALAGAASVGASENGKVGIIFPPGVSSEEGLRRVIAAGGLPIDVGAFDNIVIAWAESPAFQTLIKNEGAWFIVDPDGFGGCLRPLFAENYPFRREA